jgi:hypothetical protein
LRKELAEVRKELEEKEKEGHLLQRTVNGLEKQVKALKEELDVTKAKLKRYEQTYPELEETDPSTPSSSEVSLKTPEGGPEISEPVVAESSGRRTSQPRVSQGKQSDREGTPAGTIKEQEVDAPLAKTPSHSSGTNSNRSHRRQSWEVVTESTRTQEYDSLFVRGGKVLKVETTTIVKPEKGNHKKNSSSGSQKKKSRSKKDIK